MVTDWTYKPYCGAGSPRTPEPALWVMRHLATKLALTGWTLRSGGDQGPDAAFEAGCVDAAVGMPYDPETRRRRVPAREVYGPADAEELRGHPADSEEYAHYTALSSAARDAHPDWKRCDDRAQLRLMAGLMRLLGPYPLQAPVPVHFLAYWHDGNGDTGQIVRYAQRWNRGVYGVWGPDPGQKIDLRNLAEPAVLERALAKIDIKPADYRAQWNLDAAYRAGSAPQGAWPQTPQPSPALDPAPGPAPTGPTVWLLGHGDDPQPALVRRLVANQITRVVDVRPDADSPDLQAPWTLPAELAEHLGLQGIAYRRLPGLASEDPEDLRAAVGVLAVKLRAHPDERVALLDYPGPGDRQRQIGRLLPLLREQGLAPLRIARDGSASPA